MLPMKKLEHRNQAERCCGREYALFSRARGTHPLARTTVLWNYESVKAFSLRGFETALLLLLAREGGERKEGLELLIVLESRLCFIAVGYSHVCKY